MSIAMCQKELFDKLRQLDPSIIVDGVPDEAQYISAPYRIMYVLKEVNGGSGWSLCDHLQSGGRGCGRKAFLIFKKNCHGQKWKKTVGPDVKRCFLKSVLLM